MASATTAKTINQDDLTLTDAALKRQLPFAQFEFIDVTFGAADTDEVITFKKIRPTLPDTVRWLDISPGTVYTGGIDTVARIYRSSGPTRKAFTGKYIALRCSVAGYSTRLLIFTERQGNG